MLKNSKNEKFPRAENVKIVEFRKTKKKNNNVRKCEESEKFWNFQKVSKY